MERDVIEDLLAQRGALHVHPRGSDAHLRVTSVDQLVESIDVEAVTDVYPDWVEALDERKIIKRKYRDHGPIHINDSGPVRNEVIEFVGNRFVTEEELDKFFSKLEEDKGRKVDYRKWFKRNGRYFENVKAKGKRLLILSGLGKKVFEHILRRKTDLRESALPFESWKIEDDLLSSMVDEAVGSWHVVQPGLRMQLAGLRHLRGWSVRVYRQGEKHRRLEMLGDGKSVSISGEPGGMWSIVSAYGDSRGGHLDGSNGQVPQPVIHQQVDEPTMEAWLRKIGAPSIAAVDVMKVNEDHVS